MPRKRSKARRRIFGNVATLSNPNIIHHNSHRRMRGLKYPLQLSCRKPNPQVPLYPMVISNSNNNTNSSFLQTRTLMDVDAVAVVEDTSVDSTARPIVSCVGIVDDSLTVLTRSTLHPFISLAWVQDLSMVLLRKVSVCLGSPKPVVMRTDPHDPS